MRPLIDVPTNMRYNMSTTNRRTGAFFMPWGYFHNPIFANKERRIARVDECPAFGW